MMLSVFIRQRRINLRKPARHRESLRRGGRVCVLFNLIPWANSIQQDLTSLSIGASMISVLCEEDLIICIFRCYTSIAQLLNDCQVPICNTFINNAGLMIRLCYSFRC